MTAAVATAANAGGVLLRQKPPVGIRDAALGLGRARPAAVHLFSIERLTPGPSFPQGVQSVPVSGGLLSPPLLPATSATFATPWSMLLPTVMPTRVANFTPRAVV